MSADDVIQGALGSFMVDHDTAPSEALRRLSELGDAEARALRRWAAEWTALDDARYAMQSGRRWSEILGEEHATGGGA